MYDYDDLNYFDDPPLSEARVRQIATEEQFRNLAAMQEAAVVVAEKRQVAIERAERQHPGFQRLYNDPHVTARYWQEHPAHARLIGQAEIAGTPEDIDEFYRQFYDRATKYADEAPQQQPSGSVRNMPAASAFSLQAINSLPVENRRAVIEALGNRVANLSVDEADSENNRFKAERGE